MNIFLSNENSIIESVKCLDNKRLNKSCVEVYQLLTSAIKEINGEQIHGYKNHPVYVFFKSNPNFLAWYGLMACKEYEFRFSKTHSIYSFFYSHCINNNKEMKQPPFIPYYMSGSINTADCIRTTQNVSNLFRQKLTLKWNADKDKKRNPTWTNREIPSWYL